MDRIDMSLDDIIKQNKKTKKLRTPKQTPVRPQSRIRQFRGRAGRARQRQRGGRLSSQAAVVTKRGGTGRGAVRGARRGRGGIRSRGARQNLAQTQLNRPGSAKSQMSQQSIRSNRGRGRGRGIRRRGRGRGAGLAALRQGNVQTQQQIQQRVRKAKQFLTKRGTQQIQKTSRQNVVNQRRGLPAIQRQQVLPKNRINRNFRSDQILLQHQQQQPQQNRGRRRWGRTTVTEGGSGGIMTISVTNDQTRKGDVQVIMGRPRAPRIRRPASQTMQPEQNLSQSYADSNINDVQVTVRSQGQQARGAGRGRRGRGRGGRGRGGRGGRGRAPNQRQESITEQIQSMRPTESVQYRFNRTDFGQAQTGVLLSDRFASHHGSKQVSTSSSSQGRVVMM